MQVQLVQFVEYFQRYQYHCRFQEYHNARDQNRGKDIRRTQSEGLETIRAT